jgi:hypothetical protein
MRWLLLVILLVPLTTLGCSEGVSQREGFGVEYKNNLNSWRVVPIVIDGHKYILATGGDSGACSICPAKSD